MKYPLSFGILPVICMLLIPLQGRGQPDLDVSFDSPEGWAMKYFAAVGLMHGNGPPLDLSKNQWALGFELDNIPHLGEGYRKVGFNGTKEEDLNKAPLLARPLVHYGLTNRLSLTATYVPPVEVFDGLTTHLAGLSINFITLRRERFRLDLRLVGQWSEAEGDFTAPSEIAGDPDPQRNPFAAIAPSEDTYSSWTASAEANLYYQLIPERNIYLFVNTAYAYGDFEFDVYVPQANNQQHTRHLFSDGYFWIFGTGVDYSFNEAWSARLALVYAPLDVRRPADYTIENDSLINFRLAVNYRL